MHYRDFRVLSGWPVIRPELRLATENVREGDYTLVIEDRLIYLAITSGSTATRQKRAGGQIIVLQFRTLHPS